MSVQLIVVGEARLIGVTRMGLERAGEVTVSKSGFSFKITLDNLPHSVFPITVFVSRKGLRRVDAGEVDRVDVVVRTGDERNESCEAHPDL